jgi:hypothetical protein
MLRWYYTSGGTINGGGCTESVHSLPLTERICMTTTVETHPFSDSMMPLGWITITNASDGTTAVYGIFDTQEEAISHGDKLINAHVVRIYKPTLH